MTGLNDLGKEAYERAVRKGFYENPPSVLERIALVHSELSEACEEHRQGRDGLWYDGAKPEGLGVELADAVIRIADMCHYLGLNLDHLIRLKSDYNETRPYKHGKKL